MINRQEIIEFCREFGLVANVIEKDYVLGWILAGISNHPVLGSDWIFKGGTCLKKCYFETYRFSEDLDFTLKQHASQDKKFLINAFKDISEFVYDTSGTEIPHDLIRFDIYENPRGKISIQGRLAYRGPLRPRGDLPRIKLDLTNDELLCLTPAIQKVHHPYSDGPETGISVVCYSFEEIFAEKLRALTERLRPRDLYDVVHLYRHNGRNYDRPKIVETLKKKCDFKEISVPTMESLEVKPERTELEAEWANMLGHQVPVLPSFEQFWQVLPEIFEWLRQTVKKVTLQPIGSHGIEIDSKWRPPTMSAAWHAVVPLEMIRFAAANRLCVQLDYIDADGNKKKPVVEPYSLRRTKDGNLLLYTVKHVTGEVRTYRVDRIRKSEVTRVSFVPRYTVELVT